MTLSSREGQRIPDVALCRLRDGKVERVSAAEFFDGRRVLVFALPGAFTPTCSTAQGNERRFRWPSPSTGHGDAEARRFLKLLFGLWDWDVIATPFVSFAPSCASW
jgi:hypothetical protein